MTIWLLMSWAGASDLIVGPGTANPDITTALGNASNGDRLLLQGPEWHGSYTITANITIMPDYGHTVLLTVDDSVGGSPEDDGFFTIDGADVTIQDLAIDAGGEFRGLRVINGGSLTLERVEIRNAHVEDDWGAGIQVRGSGSHLELTDCNLRDNQHTGTQAGGAVAVEIGATMNATGSRFADNRTDDEGGALWCSGVCTVTDSLFVGNTAAGDGGAVVFRSTPYSSVDGSRFCHNSALGAGGALRILQPTDPLSNNVFWGNHAGNGGAVQTVEDVTLTHTDFLRNTTDNDGAAVYAASSTATVVNAIVVDHTSPGASVFRGGNVIVDHVLYHGNTMPMLGVGAGELGVVNAPPGFAAYDPLDCEGSDLSLLAGSPALGAGDPAGSDLGAFGQLCETEVPADGLDQDCDGVDACYTDTDGDGYGTDVLVAGTDLTCTNPGEALEPGDCDDSLLGVNPDAMETCNGVDDDCDAALDEEGDPVDWFLDADGDGHGDPDTATASCPPPSPEHVLVGDDCDDSEPDAYPGATEICDGIDNDCDQAVDDACTTTPGGGPDTKWEDEAAPDGCSCDSAAPSPAWLLLLTAFGMRRRR